MLKLNLPEYQFNIKKQRNRLAIFDSLRRKFVALTPEEWVRQNFVAFLINEKHYPQGLMANEVEMDQNGIKRRSDTLVANQQGEPLMIVEYKAPHIEITQKVFDQIVRYNMVLKSKYLTVSNGMTHYCCQINYTDNSYTFLSEIPDYENL
ncbi:MAG: type I restriction enzyme HsdR N-terminal domain-containing protein [Muribaculaceae bacterium]|nr:type I restriction enzyme HsdR N-terminal domain-containing protein [Muribaculaceae bacterium]